MCTETSRTEDRERLAELGGMLNHSRRVAEALAYYDLRYRAEQLGIPVSLMDPRSPQTVAELVAAVVAAERAL